MEDEAVRDRSTAKAPDEDAPALSGLHARLFALRMKAVSSNISL